MNDSPDKEVTDLLVAWGEGDDAALERLVPLVHKELRRRAHRYLRKERGGHTLQTTALINEFYLRLAGAREVSWKDRNHFFAISAQQMRRILVDYARTRKSQKRGGGVPPLELDEALDVAAGDEPDLLAIHDALTALERLDPKKANIVELRFFGGMNARETADLLETSPSSVRREFSLAKVWLLRELSR